MHEADIVRISLSLVLIIGLILLSAWLAKRSGLLRQKGAQRIEILSSQSVGPRTNLVLVQVAGQQLLIGVTPQNITTLHHLGVANAPTTASGIQNPVTDQPADNAYSQQHSNASTPAAFKDLLRRRQQHNVS
ncbi:flagellar biosynthetic protein FliO [Paenalcaligenes niemegkensis]|uniref:flagellar biosynthetic protein FliO n=1 Tax=Paenalcaligenes niemegkensis TaxID=2895469 RepID=UPI001EE7DA56|nr:flagellar biosynthetic protein FliO [Paenalcaligenes niemegkensis]MCQ9616001.1 flagellar biosynthetic protein FliO [Paenalcaligenes niemegkensis]